VKTVLASLIASGMVSLFYHSQRMPADDRSFDRFSATTPTANCQLPRLPIAICGYRSIITSTFQLKGNIILATHTKWLLFITGQI
jgi:hypothetical protein